MDCSRITNRPVFAGVVLQRHDFATVTRNEVEAVVAIAANLVPTIADDVVLEVFVCKVEESLLGLACFTEDIDPIFPFLRLLAGGELVDMVGDEFLKRVFIK